MRSPTRRVATGIALAAASAVLLAGCTVGTGEAPTPTGTTPATSGSGSAATTDATIQSLLDEAAAGSFDKHALGSLLAEIRVDGDVVAQVALGDAMAGEPITLDGRFRNGAVAITYVSTVMLRLAEEGVIDLDHPIEPWVPDLPESDEVTPRMLANMTSGYPDHVGNQAFVDAFIADPFRNWTTEELLEFSIGAPRSFAPGDNWDYSHSGYIVLGQVMEAATGKRLEELIDEYVLDPLELDATVASQTPAIPEPVVHAFTAERGVWEDSTHWNPSWTLPDGAVETSTISDMAASFDAIVGRGELLEASSYEELIDPALVGFGEPLDGCRTCRTLTENGSYGLGTFLIGDWVKQTPLFGGYASSVVTLPESHSDDGRAVTIAVAVTYTHDSFDDWDAVLPNSADELALRLGAELVPDNPPPTGG
jgi:CubicO group peptidase (beta-lactamase class C family)